MEVLIICLLVGCFWGFLNTLVAKKNGRDKNLSFLMGFLFGFFSIVVYLIIGETEEMKVNRVRKAMGKKA